jgi:alkylhydroperoxidase/carboxymuconolactone decarboxylase family protein YurZ
MAQITEGSARILRDLATARPPVVGRVVGFDPDGEALTRVERRVFALVGLAALVALNASEPGIQAQVTSCLAAGADAEDIVGVLVAVAPYAGASRVVSAAEPIMHALGIPGDDGTPMAWTHETRET